MTALPTFTPGCTLNIPAGIHGARPVRIHVLTRRTLPDGGIHAWGHVVRADGTRGRNTAATLHPIHAARITVDNPYDETAAGLTGRDRSYSLARKGSVVLLWGDRDDPREFRHDSDQAAADRFRELAAQLAGRQP